jgi:hypothetical protein
MAKRRSNQERSARQSPGEFERTLADAEADALRPASLDDDPAFGGDEPLEDGEVSPQVPAAPGEPARCACGSEEFVLEAYLSVIRGKPQPEPLEVEALTCPQCGREYEAVWLESGLVARGDLLGQIDLDD